MKRSLILASVVAAGCLTGATNPGEQPAALDVLFIGNSLTYEHDLPSLLEALMEEGLGRDVTVASIAHPNYALVDHWSDGDALEAIRSSQPGVVVLQQGPSATEGRPYLLEYVGLFDEVIRASGGFPALYMVWPSIQRYSDFDGVLDSYRAAAENVDGYFFPAGEAWRIAWETDASLGLYASDGFHPSELGSYLAALVMYEQLSGLDARDLPAWIPIGVEPISLEADVAALLQGAAHQANERHARDLGGA